MFQFLAVASLTLVIAGAAQAQETDKVNPGDSGGNQTPGVYGLTADGTWDCKDPSGTYLGAVVVANLSYAFINPDETVGAYGTLNKDDWVDIPAFFILTGELKTRFAAVGLSLIGPENRPADFAAWDKLRLQLVVTPEIKFFCAHRRGPAT